MAIDCQAFRQASRRMWQDQMLLWRMRRGSREALRAIYDKYADYLLTVAMNLTGDVAAAEDAVQDVFVRLTESGRTWTLNGSLKAYLARCVVNRPRPPPPASTP